MADDRGARTSDQGAGGNRGRDVAPDGRSHDVDGATVGRKAKTSAAAVFSLVFGLSALICVLSLVLGPIGIVLGLIGLILGIAAMKMTKKPGVTGKGVAIGGLVLSVLALLLAIAAAVGITTVLNNDEARNRLEQLRQEIPSSVMVPQP